MKTGECELCLEYKTLDEEKKNCIDPVCASPETQFINKDGICIDCDEYQVTKDDKISCE